jgi:KDO2-lipid IV(A) lauroyltransferase
VIGRAREWGKFATYAALRPIVHRLPRRAFYALAGGLGTINYLLHGVLRRRVRENLRLAYGERKTRREIEHITHNYFRSRSQFVLEALLLPHINERRYDTWFIYHNIHVIEQLVAERRGAVIPLVHFGPFTLAGTRLARFGLPVTDIAQDPETTDMSTLARRISQERYERWQAGGGALVETTRFLRRALASVRSGEAVSVFFDAPPSGATMTAGYLAGRYCRLHRGAVTIALKTGAPLLLMASYRDSAHRIHLHITGTIRVEQTGDRDEDVRVHMQRVADYMSNWIHRFPSQWIMWKEFDERLLPAPSDTPAQKSPTAAPPDALPRMRRRHQ